MAIYLVGDIQGCYNELTALMSKVDFDKSKDTLYLAGDLVARGPNSLETLRLVKSLNDSAKIVLGNHDLHFLAVHAGIKKAKKSDYLADLLNAPDVNDLADWLAAQPLIQKITNSSSCPVNERNNTSAYMSHAGISPEWTLQEAKDQADFIHQKLNSPEREKWLSIMYGEKPNSWQLVKTEEERFRYSINALTRMRFCFTDGSLEFLQKDSPSATKIPNLLPWFELSQTINTTPWVFGHWASLMGKVNHNNIYPLDTGCVWGHKLTMLRWDDQKYFTQQAI